MKIKYLGHSAFLFCGKDKSVVTDPFSGIGYPMEKVKADYCLISHDHFDHDYVDGVECKKIIRRYNLSSRRRRRISDGVFDRRNRQSRRNAYSRRRELYD